MNSLYAYLYDDFLSNRQYDRALANVETRASALGIQGRHSRLAIFRSAKELVTGLVREGAETIVVVGNDASLLKTMWFLPDMNVTVGYIPVEEPCALANVLGIPKGDAASDIVAARRIESVDVGRVNDRYFLTEVFIDSTKASVDIDGYFRIAPAKLGSIAIRNLGSGAHGGAAADARDGWLDVVVRPIDTDERRTRIFSWLRPNVMQETRLLMKEGAIRSEEPIDVNVDGYRMNGFEFRLDVVPKKLKLITGRHKKLDARSEDLSKFINLGTFSPTSK